MKLVIERKKVGGYYLEDIPKYLKRYSSYFLIYPLKFLPESDIKRNVRQTILKYYNSVPLFLALNKGDTAIQVGTPNIRTMKRFSHLVGNTGKVFIIEADVDNISQLEKGKKAHHLENVYIIPSAAWSKQTELEFLLSDIRKGDHKIPIDNVLVDNDYNNNYTSIKVKADTVDNLMMCQGVNSFNYISITVNGAELEVLKGAKKLIKNSKNCRIYSKGHSLVDGVPLNQFIKEYLAQFDGYKIMITKGELSNSNQKEWKRRAGDIFAWKTA